MATVHVTDARATTSILCHALFLWARFSSKMMSTMDPTDVRKLRANTKQWKESLSTWMTAGWTKMAELVKSGDSSSDEKLQSLNAKFKTKKQNRGFHKRCMEQMNVIMAYQYELIAKAGKAVDQMCK